MTREDPTIYVYPTAGQLERWNQRKEKGDANSRSELILDLVQAGIRVDTASLMRVMPHESVHRRRHQHNDLKAFDEVEHARNQMESMIVNLHLESWRFYLTKATEVERGL